MAETRGRSGTLVGLAVGTRCYVPDKRRVWLPVTVEYVDPHTQVVTFLVDPCDDDGAKKNKKATLLEMSLREHPHFPLQNASALTPGGYEDMIELNHLHEAAILHNLRRRFKARLPYTYTGKICLAVNPYQWLEELYTGDLHVKYLGAPSRKLLPPHVYAVSVAAFKHMNAQSENQSILVSGESGAGKTETTKILMDNLARIANATASSRQQQSTIQRILDVNPLLESFGNAKTKRNDNSSRFGKFTQLQFQAQRDKTMVLCGAKCETYLLEKTRVVTQEKGERNYHIFYQLFHGSSSQEKQQWGLEDGGKMTQFQYIEDDDAHMRDKDVRNYAKTKQALSLLGLSDHDRQALFQTLAGVLHLGQATFQADKLNEDGSHVVQSSILIAGELLGLSLAPMEKALCSRTMKAGGDVYAVPLSLTQATSSRDALAKAVYSKVFDWMVAQINRSLSAPDADVHQTIGVLDIFGFESFVHNSFEQLCINYANEKLQQKFTQDVFKAVQDEYQIEQITWDHIEYADNADVLALIEGKLGIIALLNEEIVRPKGNDEGFVGKLSTSFRQQKKIIDFARISRTQFSIHHYADTVKYEANGFLEKHKDALLPDLSELMRGSSEPFVKMLFEPKVEATAVAAAVPAAGGPGRARRFGGGAGGAGSGGGGKADSQTVGTQFKQSLNRLMENINKTNVHYIRCIKPNNDKSTTAIDEQMVVNQLRCAGVIEAICIARAGYPNRMKHEEFVNEFDIFLLDAQRQRIGDERKLCLVLAKQFQLRSPEEYQMGKTKIYLQQGVLERLESAKAEKLFASVALIQAHWRRVLARRRYVEMYAALVQIQRRAHVFVAVLRFKRVRHSVRLLQRVWRGHVGRCEYFACLCEDRARRIQRVWRGYVGRCIFHDRLCHVRSIQLQCAWRCFAARKRLQNLRLAHMKEQARLRALELERQRQLELQRQRERDEQARQRRLAEEAEAEARRRKHEQLQREQRAREERERREREELERIEAERLERERQEQERRERERLEWERLERARLEQERLERERLEMERLEQERLEAHRLECERLEREQREHEERIRRARQEQEAREREERETREREEHAAVSLQRVARGGLARQKYAQLVLEDEVLKRKEAERQQIGDPVELEAATVENDKLKKQLEELLEANIELETLVSEWKCEQEVLRATSHLQETDLKRQITQERQKLETARGEYSTLCAYMDQNGGERPPLRGRAAVDHGAHPEHNDTDSDDGSNSSGAEGDVFASPFTDDRTSSNVSSFLHRPTFSTRMQSRKDESARMLRVGAKQLGLGRAKQWVGGAKKGPKKADATSSSSASQLPPTTVAAATADATATGRPSSKGSSARMPKFRWKKTANVQ